MHHLQKTLLLATEMGKSLGRGEILLEKMQIVDF